MRCPVCSAETGNAGFCPKCGKKLDQTAAAPVIQPEQPQPPEQFMQQEPMQQIPAPPQYGQPEQFGQVPPVPPQPMPEQQFMQPEPMQQIPAPPQYGQPAPYPQQFAGQMPQQPIPQQPMPMQGQPMPQQPMPQGQFRQPGGVCRLLLIRPNKMTYMANAVRVRVNGGEMHKINNDSSIELALPPGVYNLTFSVFSIPRKTEVTIQLFGDRTLYCYPNLANALVSPMFIKPVIVQDETGVEL